MQLSESAKASNNFISILVIMDGLVL